MRFFCLIVGFWLVVALGACSPIPAEARLSVEVVDARSMPVTDGFGNVHEQMLFVSLSIRGRVLEVVLEPSEVMANASVVMFADAFTDAVAPVHYQGQVLGVADSWVRLSWFRGRPEGVLRVGQQLYLIEYDDAEDRLLASDLATDSREVFDEILQQHLVNNSPVGGVKVLPISIVVDTLYNEAHQARGLDRALSIVNSVDGLYQEQVGLRLELRVARLMVDADKDPMRPLTGNIDQLLEVFRSYRLGDVALVRGQGAVHLFSGAELSDKRVGLAYIDTICRTDGYDVGVSRIVDRDVFTFAHELAHNIGAEHDLDTQCGDHGRMMNATLRSEMQYAFSSCSVKSLRQGMGRSCVLDQPTMQFASAGLEEEGQVVAEE